MSYLVLARKWRPHVFDKVVGQDRVVKTLKNAVATGRIAHAYLFCGPRGVGKTSVARILAKGINCQEGPTSTPCNDCASCRDIDGGRALDIHEIDGASNNSVDDVRDIREKVRYLPSAGKYKIYIIDEVHMLSGAAFNALLKTLEEPPKHVIFIFATTEPHKLPATIISRCQRFDFKRISEAEIAENVGVIAREEGLELPDRSLKLIAGAADGGMRDALSLLDRVISYCGNEILPQDVEELLGLVSSSLVRKIAEGIIEKDSRAVLDQAEIINREGQNPTVLMRQLMDLFHQLFLYKLGQEGIFEENSEMVSIKDKADDFSVEEILQINKLFLDYSEKVRNCSDQLLLAELFLVKMTCIKRFIPLNDLLGRLEQLEKRLSGQGGDTFKNVLPKLETASKSRNETVMPTTEGVPRRPSAQVSPAGLSDYRTDSQDEKNIWLQIVAEIKKEKSSLGALLEHHGSLKEKKDHIIRLEFDSNFSKNRVSDPDNLSLLETKFSRLLKSQVKLEILKLGKKQDQGLFSRAEHHELSRKKKLEVEVEKDPLISRTISIFEGKLVKYKETHKS